VDHALRMGLFSVLCPPLGPYAWLVARKAVRGTEANPGRYRYSARPYVGRAFAMLASAMLVLLLVIAMTGSPASAP
jgi:hypothetical protein